MSRNWDYSSSMLWSPQKYLFYVEQYYHVPLCYPYTLKCSALNINVGKKLPFWTRDHSYMMYVSRVDLTFLTHPLTDSKQISKNHYFLNPPIPVLVWYMNGLSSTYPPLLVNVIQNFYTFNVLKEEAQKCQTFYEYWRVWIKFIYSEKATKFCEIFTLLLTTVHAVKS